jgi:hypothetical protein
MLPRIDAIGEKLSGRFPALPSVLQPHVRIQAKSETLFFPVKAILQPPPLAPGWRDFKVEPALVGELARFARRLGIPYDHLG